MSETDDSARLEAWQLLGYADSVLHTESGPETAELLQEVWPAAVAAAYARGLAGERPVSPVRFVIEKDPGYEDYSCVFEPLGVASQGATVREAILATVEAVACYVEGHADCALEERGLDPLPASSSVSELPWCCEQCDAAATRQAAREEMLGSMQERSKALHALANEARTQVRGVGDGAWTACIRYRGAADELDAILRACGGRTGGGTA